MQTSIVGKAADATLGTCLRLTAIMAGCRAVTCLMELGWRLVDQAVSSLNPKLAKAEEEEEETGSFWRPGFYRLIDVRGELKKEDTLNLLKNTAHYLMLAMVVKEVADLLFGPPIQGYNVVGKFVGMQMLPNGTLSNLPRWVDWKRFFEPM